MRFLWQIPALHQTSLYPAFLIRQLGGYGLNPAWPVDMDVWLRFFAAGFKAAKIPARAPWPPAPSGGVIARHLPAIYGGQGSATTARATQAAIGRHGTGELKMPSSPVVGPLYGWRQHSGQGTRNSGRCSIDNLRRCKVGPSFARYRVRVYMPQAYGCGVDCGALLVI